MCLLCSRKIFKCESIIYIYSLYVPNSNKYMENREQSKLKIASDPQKTHKFGI